MTAAMVPSPPDPGAKEATLGGGRLITMREIRAKFRVGCTAGYELVRRPGFPARVVVSPWCHRWLESEVDAFREALREHLVPRRAQPPGPAARTLRLTGEEHPVRARRDSR